MSTSNADDHTTDKNEKCVKCSKIVYENSNSIACDKCQGWLHLRCSGLKRKDFVKITEDTEFICKYCKNSPCGKCNAPVYPFQNAIQCSHDDCLSWYHLRCTHFTSGEYYNRKSRLHTEAWYCPECTHLPFDNINCNEFTQLINDDTRLKEYFNILTCNKKFSNKCSVCKRGISRKNIPKSFPCTSCHTYVHRTCTNLSQSEILQLTPSQIRHWECNTCRVNHFPLQDIDNLQLTHLSFNSNMQCQCSNQTADTPIDQSAVFWINKDYT